ncbi:kinesin light chain [Pyronema domesticum]|nr:kinesin light chain [Pyronema domesticum]
MSHVSVALHGLGGVGKTQDVLDFVYSCKKSHSVFWIYCESPTRFDEDYRKLAKLVKIPGYNELDPSQDTRGIVKNWLESKESGDWILVFDNADKKTDFFPGSTGGESCGLAKYMPKCAKGTVVITTRDYEVAQQLAGWRGVLTKEAMVPADATTLFQRHYPSGAPYNNADCDKLLHELQYLPLAITQVASYLEMNRKTITPTQYLTKFQQTKADQQQLLSKAVYNPFRPELPVSSAGSAETVLTTFEITFRQIQKQSPLAGSILRLIACIDAQEIPHELLAELESRSDEIMLGEALAQLLNFSLLQLQVGSAGTRYTLHSLVHLAIQYSMSPEEKVSTIETTARVLSHVIPPYGAFKHWPRWRHYLPHTTAFLSYAGKELNNIHIATICFSMADYLVNTGRYRDSQPLAERSTTIRNLLLGHERPETLKSMLLLARGFFEIGMRDECEELEVKVVALSEKILGEDHPDTLTAMSNLATTLRNKGRWDEAETLQRKVLETCKVVLGEDHPDTLAAMSNLANTLWNKGRLDEAEKLQRKVLETRKVVLGEDHPDTLKIMSNLANTLWNKGRLDEAETLQQKVLETCKVVLGEDHPHTLTIMINLATTLRNKGRWDEAETLQQKVLETCKVVLGEDHPHTLTIMINLATTLRNKGRWDEAETLQRKVLETCKVVLGEDHPDTLAAMSNLATTLWNKGRWDEAETLQQKVLETHKVVLGEDHPHTLAAMSNLAVMLRNKGRWDEAETLQQKVLETCKVVLGEDHPDTLAAMHSLAHTYHDKASLYIAIEMMEEVVSRRLRILGSEDKDTKSSMTYLNMWKAKRED